MGQALTIDTLKYAEKLMAAGVPEDQAKAQARILAEVIDENLATKRDLKEMELRLEARLIKWMLGCALGLAALIIAQAPFIISALK